MGDAEREGGTFDWIEERGADVVDRMAQHLFNTAGEPTIPAEVKFPKIPGYEVRGLLGRGGMGQVYLAWQQRLQRLVAIKILPPEASLQPHLIARFAREIVAAGKLTHPSVVTAYDANEHQGIHYLVMEYVSGKTLAALVNESGTLEVSVACEIVRQAAIGLQSVHDAGLIHRDIKPSNLMLADDGQVRILDLGLARFGESSDDLSSTGQVLGTLAYMAPEQAASEPTVDSRADLYGLAATLLKLLSGCSPLDALSHLSPVKRLVAIASGDLPSRESLTEHLPPELVDILDRMLALNPDDRFQCGGDFAEALEAFSSVDALLEFAKEFEPNEAQPPTLETIKETIANNPGSTSQVNSSSSVETEVLVRSSSVAEQERSVSPPESRGAMRSILVGLAVLCAIGGLVSLLAQSFFVKTPDGTIQIVINDPKVSLGVEGGVYTFQDRGKQIVMTPGVKTLRLERDGFEFETRNFVMRRGDNPALTIDFLDGEVRVEQGTHKIAAKPILRNDQVSRDDRVSLATDEPSPPPSDPYVKTASWERGTQIGALPGLIPTPSKRDRVKRWQITARSAGHSVTSAVWSPDGKWVACFADAFGSFRSHCRVGELRLYDATTHRLARVLSIGRGHQVCWSPDSQWVSIGDWDRGGRSIRLYHVDGTPGVHVPVETYHEKHVWSPDSRQLIVYGDYNAPSHIFTLIDVSSQTVRELGDHKMPIRDVAWHPDGELLATAGEDSIVQIWTDDGALLATLEHSDPVRSIQWDPSGQWLAATGNESGLQLWETDGTKGKWFDHEGERTNYVCWSPDGKFLATITDKDVLRVWDESGELIRKYSGRHTVSRTFWVPQPVYWHPKSVGLIARQMTDSGRSDSVYLSLANDFTHHFGPVGYSQWSPSGTSLLFSSYLFPSASHSLFHFREGSFERVRWEHQVLNGTITNHLRGVESSWNPDGSQCLLATEYWEGGDLVGGDNLCFFNAKGEHLATPIQSVVIRELAVHPRDNRIAVGDRLGNIRVISRAGHQLAAWNTTAVGAPIEEGDAANGSTESDQSVADPVVMDLDWHPSGSVLSSCDKNNVYVWNTDDVALLAYTPVQRANGQDLSAEFKPADGEKLSIAAGYRATLWDWRNERHPNWKDLERNAGGRLHWSPSGNKLITWGSGGRAAFVWNDSFRLQSQVAIGDGRYVGVAWWHPGERLLLSDPQRGNRHDVFDWETNPHISVSKIDAMNLAVSHDGKTIAATHVGKNQYPLPRSVPQLFASDGSNGPILEAVGDLFGVHTMNTPIAFSSDDKFLIAAVANRIGVWDVSTGKLDRVMLLLPDDQMATFSPAGELLYATPNADDELVYLVESDDGRLDIFSREEFLKR